MRNLLFTAIALLISALSLKADPIDEKQAALIAESLCENVQPALVKRAQRNEAKARNTDANVTKTPPYYIFSRGENKGYVIVSGDDCLPEILGYTEEGDFDEATAPPHLLVWLDYYASIIEDAQQAGQNISRKSPKRAPQKAASRETVPPLMTTHWHQNWPYNSHCPFLKNSNNRAVTGCVATAGAQVVFYYHKDNPDFLGHTTPTYGYGDAPVTESVPKGTPLKWDLMLNSYGTQPDEYADAVGEFVFAVGAATWLTYGSSTAGQIRDLVNTFSSGYNLTGTCVYKNGMATATWEDMILGELALGHPMVYSGYNPDSGGHAVVIDGYDSVKKLFHFNFGWGGQGDGYYTVDDETGMNGFNSEQGMTYKVAPKKQNLSASFSLPGNFYTAHDNKVRVKVKNNGTLDYSGIYLFMLSPDAKPASISKANASDKTTVLPNDGSETILEFSLKPALQRNYRVFVTDAQLNTLVDTTLYANNLTANLDFNSIRVIGSSKTETHNNKVYTVVNGTKVSVVANLTNLDDVDFQGSPYFELFKSTDDGETFELVGTKSLLNALLPAKQAGDLKLNMTSTSSCPIEEGNLYYVTLRNPLMTSNSTTVNYQDNDSVAYFTVKTVETPLSASLDGTTVVFQGQWNPNEFTTIVNRSSMSKAQDYDLSQVGDIDEVPDIASKPNAYVYVNDESVAKGRNVVKKNALTAGNISLTDQYDFAQAAEVTAERAEFSFEAVPGEWQLLTVPFSAQVPEGIVAKEITSHSSVGINNKTNIVTAFEGGKTYLIMPTAAINTIVAENVKVLNNVAVNTDEAVIGTFINTKAPVGAFYVDTYTENFELISGEEKDIKAFGGYFVSSVNKKSFKASSNLTLDISYKKLAEALIDANKAKKDYQDVVTDEANAAFDQAIAEANELFTNRSMTEITEINNFVAQLKTLTEEYKHAIADDVTDTEIDMTDRIVNPSFETGNIKGWNHDGAGVTAKESASLNYRGVGADGRYLAYAYDDATLQGVGIYQTIEGLTPGNYYMTVKVGTDPGEKVTVFANEVEVEANGHEFGQYYLNDVVIRGITVGEDGTLTIGVKTGHWYKADDFRLYFTGANEATGIADVDDDENANTLITVTPATGGLTIRSKGANSVSVYSVTGMLVFGETVDGTTFVTLPQGIYIVDGKKYIVK